MAESSFPPIAPTAFATGSSSSLPADSDDALGDVCSICLESFSAIDPSSITTCKHEYHLQCILEWSQRSKECPICWQSLVLMDSASQQLLAAVQIEGSLRPRQSASARHALPLYINYPETECEPLCTGSSELSDSILQRVAAAMSRTQHVGRSQRQSSLDRGSSESPMFPFYGMANTRQVHASSLEDCNSPYASSGYTSSSSLSHSPASLSPTTPHTPQPRDTDCSRDGHYIARPFSSQSLPNESQRPGSPEMSAFSDSIKSRLSAASAKYKSSFSKGTQGLKDNFKEKFSINNSSVKELSKGVQREMSAGIAGLSKMIDRLEIKSKRGSQIFNDVQRPFDIFSKGKQVQEDVAGHPLSKNHQMKNSEGLHFDGPTHSSCSIEMPHEVSKAKEGH